MKIAFVTDLHIGRYKGDLNFLDSQLLFLKEFVEYVNDPINEIDKVIIPGDVWDNRNTISLLVFNRITDEFFKNLKVETHIILGNHDMYYLENSNINLVKYLENVNPNIKFIEELTVLKEDGKKFMFVPFMYNTDKVKEFKDTLKKEVKTDYVIGHFEIDKTFPGCKMRLNDFEKHTKRVISGHYHINSTFKHKTLKFDYIGTPYELDRGDINTFKGFHILDTHTGVMDSIENNVSIKFKDIFLEDIIDKKITEDDIKGNIVNIVVKKSVYNDLGENSIYRNIALNNHIKTISDMNPFKIKRKSMNDVSRKEVLSDNSESESETQSFYDIEDLFDIWLEIDDNKPVDCDVDNIKKYLTEELKSIRGL